ncbi:mannose-6-phosphate isomerase, class I [Jatrophihabitans endophyticus]|uniref:mannose-6-phosphate isomerase, class I n=1 Tax=Jatrophihabitans endophyticus TaxID=1206085 RepID=UPI0009334310
MIALDGVVRRYEWGSRTAIPRLLGREPDGRPAAELWFGAHPDDPSPTLAGATLVDVIDGDPLGALGQGVLGRFGPRLPFLLKVLAADTALSIQVHPTLDEARAGFAAEDDAGVPRDAPNRNYRDANHKPELICALTPFEALCGFRPPERTAQLLADLDVPELDFLGELLRGEDPLRAAFTAILTHPDPGPLATALAARVADHGGDELRGVRLAAADFPGDVGVVLALLLNHVVLAPGEAIYLGAGNVHAYLRGTGIEIMANSDNVLRCGLTPKHIDVAELLAITDFSALADPRLPSRDGTFDVAVRDFRLTRLPLDGPVTVEDAGPLIVLCVEGRASVGDVELAPGHAAFVRADHSSPRLDGDGLVFVAGARA